MKNYIFTFLLLLTFFNLNYSQSIYEDDYQWKIPGGNYIDPTSFFSLHGYINAVYGHSSEDWKSGNFNGIGMPGQVLIPNTNNSSFQSDQALWISSEISDKTSAMMELHLVSSPSGSGAAGPGGLTIVLTEATANYKIYKNFLNFSFGTFWSPFGIQNNDWLGAQNLFTTMPLASGAFPTHYNEKGIRLDGFLKFNENAGMNYVMSIGNGYNAWDISGYNSWDLNENKTLNSRISFYPGLKKDLNIGFSYSNGMIHEGNLLNVGDTTSNKSLASYYDFNYNAFGMDGTLNVKNFKLRGYAIRSIRNFNQNAIDFNEDRFSTGYMGEISYAIKLNKINAIDEILPKFRYDYVEIKDKPLIWETFNVFSTVSFGLNVNINENFNFSFDYNVLKEEYLNNNNEYVKNDIDNNRFVARVSAKF